MEGFQESDGRVYSTKEKQAVKYPGQIIAAEVNHAPYPVLIRQVDNGYICEIGCKTFVYEGTAISGLQKLAAYFAKYEKKSEI